MNKQKLASKIWESANKMRSKIEANEYKDYILGFIFYKFLSDKEVDYLKKKGWPDEDLCNLTEEVSDTVAQCQNNLGYFISYNNLFSTWLKKDRDFNVSDVTDALSAFNRLICKSFSGVYEKIFDTLSMGLSKLGETDDKRTKSISELLQLIKDIPMDGKQDYDVLGFIYEYLISNFAANAGKKAGEFYTPHEVSILMSEIVANNLKGRDKIEIYDSTSGSGSLLITIGKSIAKYSDNNAKIVYYAQELKENTYNLTRMNLVMRGINPSNIKTRNADTLEEDWPVFAEEHDSPLYGADAVVSNPPYSQHWDPKNKESDPRFHDFGMAPKSKADYAFLLHDLYHIRPDGIMTIVLPHGVLFRGGEEEKIRRNLIEHNNIDAIIGLPANIFYGTSIPTIIMVLKRNRVNNDIMIIDASKGFVKEGKNNKLQASDIKKIVDTIIFRQTVDKFSKAVPIDKIRDNDYNLNIPRYVDSSEPAETWDIYATMFGGIPNSEIDLLNDYWSAFPSLKTILFKNNETPYSSLNVDNIKEAINQCEDIKYFRDLFNNSFKGFEGHLNTQLIEKMKELSISKEEDVLCDDVFARIKDFPLVDKYKAYQRFDDEWTSISNDIEIIQSEGFAAVDQVDPNMVTKKKNDKEIVVQDGWIGHIIPFELVQQTLLKADADKIKIKEQQLEEITSQYEELLDSLSGDDKGEDFVNEDGTAFVPKEVKKAIKAKEVEDDVLEILKKYDTLSTKEKELKKELKSETAAIHLKTKETIENLPEKEALDLLKEKWISPIVSSISKLPESIVTELVSKVDALAKKYETTFSDVENKIKSTEASLSGLLSQLSGNDFDMQGIAEFKNLLEGD